MASRAASAAKVKQQLRSHKIDLVLLDLMLGDSDGVTLIKDLLGEFSKLMILVISAHNDPLFSERSLKAGALALSDERGTCQVYICGDRIRDEWPISDDRKPGFIHL